MQKDFYRVDKESGLWYYLENYKRRRKPMHEIIRKLRKEKGLTQQQVADVLQVDRSTYAYYESGRSKLSIDIIVKLAHFYQIRYATLIGRPEPVSADG